MDTQKILSEPQKITFRQLTPDEEDIFVREIQTAFDKAAGEEFGPQEESVIPREIVLSSIHDANAETFRIFSNGVAIGGVVVRLNPETRRNGLDLMYINPEDQGFGFGQKVWRMIEVMYPETEVWETFTPFFEKRNVHFYVNKCGFHVVEFFNPHHPSTFDPGTPGGEYFLRFEKHMKPN